MATHTVYQAGQPVEQAWNYCQTCGVPIPDEYSEPVCSGCKPRNDAVTRRVQRDFQAAQGADYVRQCYQFDPETGAKRS